MKVKVEIDKVGVGAFVDNEQWDMARILREVADNIQNTPHYGEGFIVDLHDLDGEWIGTVEVSE